MEFGKLLSRQVLHADDQPRRPLSESLSSAENQFCERRDAGVSVASGETI